MPSNKKTILKSDNLFWKSRFSTRSVLVFALVFGVIGTIALWKSFAATPVLIFNGNFDTGDFSQWSDKPQQGADGDCCTVINNSDHNTAARFTVEPGDQWQNTPGERAELSATGTKYTANEGNVEHIRWQNYFPSQDLQDKLVGSSNIFTQWHHSGPNCNVPVQFQVNANATPYHIGLVVSHIKDMSKCTFYPADRYDLGKLPYDTWMSFDFYVTWSSDPHVGSVQMLINSKEVLPPTHVATMYSGYTNYLQQGFYRGATNYTSKLFLDNTSIYRYQ